MPASYRRAPNRAFNPFRIRLVKHMSRFWSPIVHDLVPYVPGEQPKITNLIKLNTNENPYGPSPLVLEAIRKETADSLRLYPDPDASKLKAKIAEYYSVKPEQIFIGNGSDEVLAHTFQALLKQNQPLLFPDISYSFYPVYCGLYQVDFKLIPLNDQFEIDLTEYPAKNGGIIFPNPNAPTGQALALAEIEKLLQRNTESVVVVDEAYVDFGAETAVTLVNRYPNLLVIQTLSKSRSLAGLRVGFAIGDASLIEGLERVKNSFNSYPIDRLAIAGAIASFEDNNYFEQTRAKIIQTRDTLVKNLQRLGFTVVPSKANFVFARHASRNAIDLNKLLREKAIIVRHFNLARISQYLRITVGTDSECAALIQALEEILQSDATQS